ncbi:hypothetical protein ACFL4Z_02210 [candidate division KSB1 bacterium]
MIIGIGNKARQGKDTAADFLKRRYGFIVIHFADALYDECKNCTILYSERERAFYMRCYDEDYSKFINLPKHIVRWIKSKGIKESGLPFDAQFIYKGMREKDSSLLQFWGTEFRRKLFEWDYWVNKVKDIIDKAPDKDYVIPDTRFRNEARFIKVYGGEVWKVIRPNYDIIDRDPRHKSEVDLDNWRYDEVIINDETIEELYKKVDEVYQRRKKLYEKRENK